MRQKERDKLRLVVEWLKWKENKSSETWSLTFCSHIIHLHFPFFQKECSWLLFQYGFKKCLVLLPLKGLFLHISLCQHSSKKTVDQGKIMWKVAPWCCLGHRTIVWRERKGQDVWPLYNLEVFYSADLTSLTQHLNESTWSLPLQNSGSIVVQ